ncbi:MAG: vitamin B12-dependent ribonucleotide reductase [Candidatus Cloacimonetes bacterium]|nr:vitamin B12-dependent ribonucleotide reductase [Candidatus Cloacimonadota bacterium]
MLLSENAKVVLEKRYFKKDESGAIIENWSQLIERVAGNISKGDPVLFRKFCALLDSGAFLPNSPTLMNAGNDLQQLSACFVLPIEDSLDSIFNSIKNAALIHKSGGGTGFSFSRLRETNSRVKTTSGVSSGPISFLRVFNAATDAVKQGGTRRGANMAILNIDHPQIIEFITAKSDPNELTNFNLSVGLTDSFMDALKNKGEFQLVSPHTHQVIETKKAEVVFDLIVEMAYKNGEPGIVFIDVINQHNPTPHIGKIESTNPCGEQPLLANEACNLGSINVHSFYENGNFNWDKLRETVFDAVEFLDCVIDQSEFPLPEIDNMARQNRKIGLGIMGYADLLFEIGLPYNSDASVSFAEELMEFIDYHAKLKSMLLAKDKGAFPNFSKSIYDTKNLKRQKNKLDWEQIMADIQANGIRNATVTTIAPTGTISMICNTSSGIEPQFSLVYVKNVMDGEKLLYVNPVFEKKMKEIGIYSKELMEQISENGSLLNVAEIPDDVKKVFITSHDISPEWHIKMQAAFQKYTDNAVSKTINFPHTATKADIKNSFLLAYELGCKGVTVYRDGSRANQVLSTGKKTSVTYDPTDQRITPRTRPEIMTGLTSRIETGCGHLYITINSDENGAFEIFTQMGKVGGCASAQLEAVARLASLCLRTNVKVESLIHQLRGIRCPSPMWYCGTVVSSCADAIAKSLESYLSLYKKGQLNGFSSSDPDVVLSSNPSSNPEKKEKKSIGGVCPDCGGTVEFSEGCKKCHLCGWSKC